MGTSYRARPRVLRGPRGAVWYSLSVVSGVRRGRVRLRREDDPHRLYAHLRLVWYGPYGHRPRVVRRWAAEGG